MEDITMKNTAKNIIWTVVEGILVVAAVAGLMFGSFQYGRSYERRKYERAVSNFVTEIGQGLGIEQASNWNEKYKADNIVEDLLKKIDR